MVLAGKMFWSLPRIATTNRWCPVWRDGQQQGTPETEEIHHLAVATWLRWHLLLDSIKDFKDVVVVGIDEMEEIMKILAIEEIHAVTMVVAPMSMKIPVVAEMMPAPGLHLMLLLTKISSQFLT